MPDQTNITDFDPVTGLTTTTLVSDHDRGSLAWAERQLGGVANEPMTPGGGGGTPPPDPAPVLTTLTPATGSAAAGPITVTLTGTGFIAESVALVNSSPVATTYVSATELTVTYDPATEGDKTVSVRNGAAGAPTSGTLTFTVTV